MRNLAQKLYLQIRTTDIGTIKNSALNTYEKVESIQFPGRTLVVAVLMFILKRHPVSRSILSCLTITKKVLKVVDWYEKRKNKNKNTRP